MKMKSNRGRKLPKGLLTEKQAREIAGVTKMTIINWCNKYSIGKKVVGRWEINEKKFRELLKSRDEVLNG